MLHAFMYKDMYKDNLKLRLLHESITKMVTLGTIHDTCLKKTQLSMLYKDRNDGLEPVCNISFLMFHWVCFV